LKTLRTAVIGAGKMGNIHAKVYRQLDGAELVAVADRDLERAEALAERHGCTATDKPESLLGAVDAVTISAPTAAHLELAELFITNGVPVLIEKPLAASAEQGRRIVELSQKHGVVVAVGHSERCNPVVQAMKRLNIEPMFIEANRVSPYPFRSMDIGVVLDVMIHDIDIILSLANSRPIKVEAVGVNAIAEHEDICNARLTFENGCIANVTASRISFEKVRKIRVFQSNAYLSLDYQNQEGMIYRKDGGGIVREKLPLEKDEPLKLEIVSFLDCVRASREPLVPGEQGRQALRVASEITRLCRENPLYKAAIEEQRTSPPIDLGKLR